MPKNFWASLFSLAIVPMVVIFALFSEQMIIQYRLQMGPLPEGITLSVTAIVFAIITAQRANTTLEILAFPIALSLFSLGVGLLAPSQEILMSVVCLASMIAGLTVLKFKQNITIRSSTYRRFKKFLRRRQLISA